MTTLNPSYDDTHGQQASTNNPALNQESFNDAIKRGGAADATGMTATGTYLKTGFLLLLTIGAGFWGWGQVQTVTVLGVETVFPPDWMFFAYLATFVLGIMAIFAGRFTWIVAILYSLSYGAILGVTSHYYDARWDGIVLQAVVATVTVFAATWVLYTTGIIKPTGKLAMFVTVSMIGLLAAVGLRLVHVPVRRQLQLSFRAVLVWYFVRGLCRIDWRPESAAGFQLYQNVRCRRCAQVYGMVWGLWPYAFHDLDVCLHPAPALASAL